jgi:hypothetical protein
MNDLHITACFHESGHTVTAYSLGYACEKIHVDEIGNGLAIINYGCDEDIAISILYGKPLDEYYRVSPDKEKAMAEKICRILISGLVAEHILAHPGSSATELTLKNAGTDLLKVEYIARKYHVDIQNAINEVYATLRAEENWRLVRVLVYCMICRTPIQLNAHEIASVFDNFASA